eukprot:15478833-Alexandrium_andersonii.AAC.1
MRAHAWTYKCYESTACEQASKSAQTRTRTRAHAHAHAHAHARTRARANAFHVQRACRGDWRWPRPSSTCSRKRVP